LIRWVDPSEVPLDACTRPAGSPSGGIRLFRLFQIDVYLHWLWIVVAVYRDQHPRRSYSSIAWNVAEYLALS